MAGQTAFDQTGQWLPDETLETLKENLVAIKGPLTTPVGKGHRSINVTLRQKLDLYACFRPVKYYEGTPSPVKEPEKVDIAIFRENTEDIYAGIDFAEGSTGAEKLKALLEEEGQLERSAFRRLPLLRSSRSQKKEACDWSKLQLIMRLVTEEKTWRSCIKETS